MVAQYTGTAGIGTYANPDATFMIDAWGLDFRCGTKSAHRWT